MDRVPTGVLKSAAKHQQSCRIIKITEIILNNNDLDEFPKVFHDHPSVQHLNLSNNLITRLDGLPEKLKTLEASGNNLENVSDVSRLQKVRKFRVKTANFKLIVQKIIFDDLSSILEY